MIKLKSSEKAITAHAESIDLWIVGCCPATLYLYRSSDIINITYNPDIYATHVYSTIIISKNQNKYC